MHDARLELDMREPDIIVIDAPESSDLPPVVASALYRYRLEEFYNPSQPRDRQGRFSSGGGTGRAPGSSAGGGPGSSGGGSGSTADAIKGGGTCDGPCESSEQLHKEMTPPPDQWSPERQAIHKKIMGDILDHVEAPEGQPVYVSMGGGGGAGKGYVLSQGLIDGVPDSKHAAHINADDIKELLPEYSQLKALSDRSAAAWTHEESSYLSKEIQKEAMNRGLNIVRDQTASNFDKVSKQLGEARDAGYKIEANYVTVPVQVAIDRAESRGARTGRYVPEAILREAHTGATNTFKALAQSTVVDKMTLVDNGQDGPPTLLATVNGGKMTVHNQEMYDEFETRG